jgi:hypothetical protein
MALAAILTELVIVRILMTAGAIDVLYAPELLVFLRTSHGNLMAFDTGYAFVLSGQPESCVIVIEVGSRYKCIFRMTVQTG